MTCEIDTSRPRVEPFALDSPTFVARPAFDFDQSIATPMLIDVIIPTYNRCELLPRALESLRAAKVPTGLDVRVTIVDNNSTDRTHEVIENWKAKFDGRLNYVLEHKQGRSAAVNAGVRSTSGDLVGIIDDDEEVESGWFECVQKVFEKGDVDYIGGPCIPRWGAEPPTWLPSNYPGVIGRVDGGNGVMSFDEYPGILMGGNAVLTRAILEKVGLYSTDLGRTDKALLSCEDEDLDRRLRAARACGFFHPELVIYHYVPPERLTKRYFRRWCFWRGVSRGVIDRAHRAEVVYAIGVPRFLFGSAVRALLRKARSRFVSNGYDSASRFSDELAVWDLAGFFYGKHFYRTEAG
jgi:glucosyl-dolichyl phosphate glucuronosyltransferase